MVFYVSVPNERDTSPDRLEVLTRLAQRVIAENGQRGRYRPVRVGDTLLTGVNSKSEAQARRIVAEAVGRDPDDLVATPRY